MSGRLELIIKNAMKFFPPYHSNEDYVNRIYAYYARSHKRYNDLNEFLKQINVPSFRLSNLLDVRWVSSHHRAIGIILRFVQISESEV